jgi:hypothetical protein
MTGREKEKMKDRNRSRYEEKTLILCSLSALPTLLDLRFSRGRSSGL